MIPVTRGAAETILQLANLARPDPEAAHELFVRMLRIWESLDLETLHPPSIEAPCHVAD